MSTEYPHLIYPESLASRTWMDWVRPLGAVALADRLESWAAHVADTDTQVPPYEVIVKLWADRYQTGEQRRRMAADVRDTLGSIRPHPTEGAVSQQDGGCQRIRIVHDSGLALPDEAYEQLKGLGDVIEPDDSRNCFALLDSLPPSERLRLAIVAGAQLVTTEALRSAALIANLDASLRPIPHPLSVYGSRLAGSEDSAFMRVATRMTARFKSGERLRHDRRPRLEWHRWPDAVIRPPVPSYVSDGMYHSRNTNNVNYMYDSAVTTVYRPDMPLRL